MGTAFRCPLLFGLELVKRTVKSDVRQASLEDRPVIGMKPPEGNSNGIHPRFWNDSACAIFLMVILCEGVMESGIHLMSMFVSARDCPPACISYW